MSVLTKESLDRRRLHSAMGENTDAYYDKLYSNYILHPDEPILEEHKDKALNIISRDIRDLERKLQTLKDKQERITLIEIV
jgi:hypothetical protein